MRKIKKILYLSTFSSLQLDGPLKIFIYLFIERYLVEKKKKEEGEVDIDVVALVGAS